MCRLREFERSDIMAVTHTFNEIVESGSAFMTEHPITQSQMLERLNNEQRVFVVESNKSVVGCYMLRPMHEGRGSHIANATYLVASASRSKGIGYQLGQHSITISKELGYKAIQFDGVVKKNEAAYRLWKKLGFTVIGTVPSGFRNIDQGYIDVYIMYKSL